jgi:putative ABC transport system substrate-binding protein
MKRRDFITFLSGAAWSLSACGQAFSQQAAKLPRIGVLVSASEPHPFADALRRGLQNLGYSEGHNLKLDVRYTQGRSDRAAELAAELVQSDVAMIVAHFTPAVRAAMAATKTIPIVMAPAGAPLQSGFIKSLYEPGGNVTGLSAMDAELGGKRIQLLSDLIPKLACVGDACNDANHRPVQPPVRGGHSGCGHGLGPAGLAGSNRRPQRIGGGFFYTSQGRRAGRYRARIFRPLFETDRADSEQSSDWVHVD